jgi:hypothetical protein
MCGNSFRSIRWGGRNLLPRVALAFIGILLLNSGSQALPLGSNDKCWHGRGEVKRIIRGLKVEITPTVDKDALNEPICHLLVRDLTGREVLSEDDSSFEIVLDDRDVNGDGIPDLVVLAFSGGAHCCWTYYFFSLGPRPGLLTKFENNRDATFLEDEKTGRIYLQIEDGTFDYFDEVCHACSPFPLVYLRLEGSNLVDISREYASDYDEIIRDRRKALTKEERQRLKALTEKPSDAEPVMEARYKALMIVFAYLYSGRETQAHKTLQELWPPFDQERIWNLILETRRNGILCYTRKDATCGEDAAAN